MKLILNSFIKTFSLIIFLFILNSCSGGNKIWDPAPAKDVPVNVRDRVAKNMEEGRGVKLFGGEKRGGTFQFASSNPLWRASLDILDFVPITNASYSGGILITDWYDDGEKEEAIKITIRFLSNEIRADAINVTIYQKNCRAYKVCQANNLDGKIKEELQLAILKKASQLEKIALKKKK